MKTKNGKKFVSVRQYIQRRPNGSFIMVRAHLRSAPALVERVLDRAGETGTVFVLRKVG